jgi:DNA-binding FrmR family transcriptional regulator
MTIDPFTTPAETERGARVKQAQDFLALAMTPECLATWSGSSTIAYNYEHGFEALRDALVGQGHAMLAVRDELADIAASLRTLAAAPSAVANVAMQVAAVQEALSELGNDVCDVHTAIKDSTAAAVDTGDSLTDAIRDLADVIDRPRWWQWRRRWTLRRHASLDEPRPANGVDLYEFRLELLRPVDLGEPGDGKPLAESAFRANYADAADIARKMLPDLCAAAGVKADPDQVYGRVEGREFGFHDLVFLPGSTVLDASEIAP